jgi:hypothetical protein
MVGVTGQQGVLTPPRHLIHIWYIQRLVFAHFLICISERIYEIDDYSLFMLFHMLIVRKGIINTYTLLPNL